MYKKVLIFSILFFLIALPIDAAGSASLSLSPASGSYKVGETFSVSIVASPNSETIDMVRAKVNFPPDLLEIQSFSFGSIYSHLSGGNNYNNAAGSLDQGSGHPGGTSASGTFGTIVFKAKSSGKAVVTISSYSLMLSVGVNKFDGNARSASYNLTDPIAEPDPISEPDLPDEEAKDEKENNNEESQTENKNENENEEEKIEEENSEGSDESRLVPTDETSGETDNTEENSSKELSEKSWHIITIFVAVLFGLAGYWYGREARSRRRF